MKSKTKVLLGISILAIALMIGMAFIFDEVAKWYLVIFFFVGLGLALLRIFVNNMIKKMKGKHISIKAIFFAALLGVGIPFQNWFRTNILFALNKEFLVPCIIVAVSSVVFMTIIFGLINQQRRIEYADQK